MKTHYFFYAMVIILLCNSCKKAVAPSTHLTCALAGKYLNYTSLEHCPDVLPGDVPSYALELNFTKKDTVDIFNGFERFRVGFTGPSDSCGYTMVKATELGDMNFVLQGDTIIRLYDTAWTKVKTPTIFRRIDDKQPWGFVHYLNECILVGTWTLFKPGIDKDHKIIFMRNGQVDGFKPYLSYEICFAGDCLEETEPHSNTISLLDDRNHYTTFSFKITPGRRHIEFYSIEDPKPDIKGERKIGPLAFEIKQ